MYKEAIERRMELVKAAELAEGGEVFLIDMGEPIKIIDLAYKMIYLSGLTPIDEDNEDPRD